jgi:hypothetical protein
MSRRRKFKSGGSESEVTIDKNKKYKWDAKGDFVEYTGDPGANEITVSGSKSSLRRMADLERNVAILATTLTTTDDGSTTSGWSSGYDNINNQTNYFKKANRMDGALTMNAAIDMNGDKITEVGTPTATTDAANKAYVDGAITDLVDGAGTSYDTLVELRNAITSNDSDVTSILTTQSGKVNKTSNQALGTAANAMTISGHTITLARGDGTTDSVVVPDNNTTYSVQDGQLSQVSFTTADNTKLDGIDTSANNYSLPASVVHDTESGALHATNALSISGHTISLNKGDGTSETVVVPDNNTTYSVGNGGLTQVNFTTADNSKLDGIAASANNYTHPGYLGDDLSVDTGALTGATVVSDIDINVTTDTSGHVTDANGTVSTRTLTLANLGYTGSATANNYSLPASVVHDTEASALSSAANAMTISGHTITLARGDGTTDVVTVPDNNTETTTTISHNTSTKTLSYVNELGATTNIDLTQYVDDTNLARLTSGSLNSSTGLATFTRDDSTTFTIDMSSFFDDTNTWRGIDDTPVNGQTTESISSNWAYDHAASSTAHPRDTRNQIAGTYNNYSHPITAGNKHVPTGGASGQFLKYSASGTAVWATPSYTTNTDTNTTYTAGNGLVLSSTSFSMDGQYTGNFVVSGDITAQGGDMTATRFNGEATTAKYADLAERYAADAPYEEGTVVMFGGEAEVTSTQGYGSTKIAGVVSTKPAFAMNEAAGNSETHPYIALQGRVPCKVIGPVSKGDILVASEVTGVATVWLDDATDPRMTAYIGIAIEDKASDTAGYVEVKVGK